LHQGYYACISYVDAQIGRIVDELRRLKLYDNTIIVLWGDHGFHLGEQDLWHKHTNFELDARVPLIIMEPGVVTPKSVPEIVELIDVYPTLAEMCNIKPKGSLSGVSMYPLLLGNESANWNNLAFNQYFRPYQALGGNDEMTHMGYSVRNERYRYTGWFEKGGDSVVIEELYELGDSGIETKNIIGSESVKDVERELKERIVHYKKGNYKMAYR